MLSAENSIRVLNVNVFGALIVLVPFYQWIIYKIQITALEEDFFFFRENKAGHIMWIICLSGLIFSEK